MMYETIKNLYSQFEFEPVVENQDRLKKFDKFIVVGMGGSHLAADLIKTWRPSTAMITHEDYGLPGMAENVFQNALVILSSYSGNTEEVLASYEMAGERGFARAAISIGGKLLKRAKEDGVPYVQIPDTGIQPRSALGFMFKGLLKLMGEEEAVREVGELHKSFHPEEYEEKGKKLAEKIKGYVPLIYASTKNEGIAKNWRVRFHETAKIPSYYDVFPELNHNEMTSFDVVDSTRLLAEKFHFIFLKDLEDQPQTLKRMEITEKLYRERGLPVEIVELGGQSELHKIFGAISLADWTAYYLAKHYGTDPEEVPMVEEFKGLVQK
ncbi:MAG: bifunctional phosphoglucose/phosphomannose isomerase [Candidatus Sungiibacteriota bacterium]|uniref:Bifunctional phosphoglucose/phosphomannose isomerase n=1 Tax=Candidatus Sungiibacteriota bacterium TaxID=2750080 RepID=A0A7T5RJ91_9BACT|nr:MAG: bifunctional phosphoglucose/phosphomannose isomerase [Candidatus Sungbacteria bacterium]